VIASDGREIFFAGAGILWGASTFVRGLRVRRESNKFSAGAAVKASNAASAKGAFSISIIGGFILTLACFVYLAQSLSQSHH